MRRLQNKGNTASLEESKNTKERVRERGETEVVEEKVDEAQRRAKDLQGVLAGLQYMPKGRVYGLVT